MDNHDSKDINSILEAMLSDEAAIFAQLGNAVAAADAHFLPTSPGDMVDLGRITYEVDKAEFRDLLCVKDACAPKPFVKELLDGDLRNLAIGILSGVSAAYDIASGIAVPVIALILKSGVERLCQGSSDSPTVTSFRNHDIVTTDLLSRR